MNAVLYYSATGGCKRIAEFFADKTGFAATDVLGLTEYEFDSAVLVFPVHCQNIPREIEKILGVLKAKALIAIAAYGRMHHGNVLYEIQKKYRLDIIAAAYVPTRHSYLQDAEFDRYGDLQPVLDKLRNPTPVIIPKSRKNPLSNMLKAWRSRLGVKLYRVESCDGCGVCSSVCPRGAIQNGKPNRKCIRCLKCVANCPKGALRAFNRLPMRLYLSKKKKDELVIYV